MQRIKKRFTSSSSDQRDQIFDQRHRLRNVSHRRLDIRFRDTPQTSEDPLRRAILSMSDAVITDVVVGTYASPNR